VVQVRARTGFETFVHTGDEDYNDFVVTVTGFDLGGTGYYAYDAHATDVDGDTLTYSLVSAPTGASIDPNTGLISFQAQTGRFDVIVGVTDRACTVKNAPAQQPSP
jgi:hypothetical protein